MPAISFGGLTSGLDTKAIVSQLMDIERNPQILLQNKLAKQNQQVSALQGINTRLASLATSAAALAKPEAFTRTAATSSSESVTTVSRPEATDASLSFSVKETAGRAGWTSAPLAAGDFGPQKITIDVPGGVPVQVTAIGGSVQALAQAINDTGGSVRATAVHTGDGQYRLMVTSAETGAKNDITGVTITPEPGSSPLAAGFTRTATGRDASIDIGGGALVTSPSNTFTDLMTGVDVTVSEAAKKSGEQVIVSSKPDSGAIAKQAAGVIGAMTVALSEMAEQSKSDVTKPGVLSGSSLIRGIQQQLASAFSVSASGASLADVGIELKRDGTVSIDEAKFASYAASNPDKAQAVTTAFATAVAEAAKQASASGTGNISQSITSAKSTVKDLGDRIADFDVRLELRRATLTRQFTALDVAISAGQNQQQWLAGQISGLPGFSR